MKQACYFCHLKTLEKLLIKYAPSNEVAEKIIFEISHLLEENREKTNPALSGLMHSKVSSLLGLEDLYVEEKKSANKTILDHYDFWKNFVKKDTENVFENAVKLAVAGNIIDYGAHCMEEDIFQQLFSIISHEFSIDKSRNLQAEIQKAKNILYLGDNAGEIVFDKLLIETMNQSNVTFAVRGMPVINDATMADALEAGIEKVCRVIENGHNAPSTLLEHTSPAFKEAFNKADLIISKGQGNFEGLMEVRGKNIYFLLMAKCKPIADLLHVKKGDLVVQHASALHNTKIEEQTLAYGI